MKRSPFDIPTPKHAGETEVFIAIAIAALAHMTEAQSYIVTESLTKSWRRNLMLGIRFGSPR